MPASDQIQTQLNDINRLIGGLVSSVDHLTTSQKEHQDSSEVGRRRLYEKFEELSSQLNSETRVISGTISGLATRVDSLSSRVDAIEPVMKAVREEGFRREGRKDRTSQLWLWCSTAAGLAGYFIHEASTFFKTPHGP
jgi:outer membrane murein-binding lipoprotein Lpp